MYLVLILLENLKKINNSSLNFLKLNEIVPKLINFIINIKTKVAKVINIQIDPLTYKLYS